MLAARPPGCARPLIGSASEELAEALFDLGSVLNQTETMDLALVYVRFALALEPNFRLAQLLLADVLSAQNEPEQSLAVLDQIPRNSPYSWSGCRRRLSPIFETLDRSDEAIAQLKDMAGRIAPRQSAPTCSSAICCATRSGSRRRPRPMTRRSAEPKTRGCPTAGRCSTTVACRKSAPATGTAPIFDRFCTCALDLKADQPLVLNYLGYSWIDKGENLDRAA